MKIMIFHASAGEGHRRAAIAIVDALNRAGVSSTDVLMEDDGSGYRGGQRQHHRKLCKQRVCDVDRGLERELDGQ